MKRDLCYYLEADIDTVYRAFLTAAQNEPFGRTCSEEDPYIFGFGLNFSMKYNMNGGALTLRFMPYSSGTAVNFRFSIAQVTGARYEKYALDLMTAAVPMIKVGFQPCHINVGAFMEYAQSVGRCSVKEPTMPTIQTNAAAPAPVVVPAPAPVATPAPVAAPASAPAPAGKTCPACGKTVLADAKFCSYCGKEIPQERFCTGCGTKLHDDALFCHSCGRKAE